MCNFPNLNGPHSSEMTIAKWLVINFGRPGPTPLTIYSARSLQRMVQAAGRVMIPIRMVSLLGFPRIIHVPLKPLRLSIFH